MPAIIESVSQIKIYMAISKPVCVYVSVCVCVPSWPHNKLQLPGTFWANKSQAIIENLRRNRRAYWPGQDKQSTHTYTMQYYSILYKYILYISRERHSWCWHETRSETFISRLCFIFGGLRPFSCDSQIENVQAISAEIYIYILWQVSTCLCGHCVSTLRASALAWLYMSDYRRVLHIYVHYKRLVHEIVL